MLMAINIKRSFTQVIQSILKHLKIENQHLKKLKILFFKEHISIIDPKIGSLFGSTAMEQLFPQKKFSNERGKWKEIILKERHTY